MDTLLNVISHGTTVEEFLSSFDDDTSAAAAHLRQVYVDNLADAGKDIPEDEALTTLEEETERALRRYLNI